MRATVRAGALSGLLGGALMALVLARLALAASPEAWRPFQNMAATLLGPDALEGGAFAMMLALAIHVATAVAWGIAFATIAGQRARGARALALGLAGGLVIMVVMTFAVLPTINPEMYARAMSVLSAWVVAHLAYGVGLAFAPWFRRRASAAGDASAAQSFHEAFPRRAGAR